MGFINPVVDSDNEGDGTFKPERRFPYVFNTLWIKGVKKKIKIYVLAFPKISEILETHAHKNLKIQIRNVANYGVLTRPRNQNTAKCSI